MLKKHKGMAKDTTGCEFEYTCCSDKNMTGDGYVTARHYVVYDGKGTGKLNVIAEADTLKEVKHLMGQQL